MIKIIIGVTVIACLCITVYFFKGKRGERIENANKRSKECEKLILAYVKIITLAITFTLGISANEIATAQNEKLQQQNEIADRETAPLFKIKEMPKKEREFYEEGYILENEKGLAAYVKFDKIESYSIRCRGRNYLLNLKNTNMGFNAKQDEEKWCCIPEVQNFPTKEISDFIKNKLEERGLENVYVTGTSYFRVNFADYKNDKYQYYFTYNDGSTELAYTEAAQLYSSYSPDGAYIDNIGTVINEETNIENTVDSLLDSLVGDANNL